MIAQAIVLTLLCSALPAYCFTHKQKAKIVISLHSQHHFSWLSICYKVFNTHGKCRAPNPPFHLGSAPVPEALPQHSLLVLNTSALCQNMLSTQQTTKVCVVQPEIGGKREGRNERRMKDRYLTCSRPDSQTIA